MSSPHVILSAVHELDGKARSFWTDDNVRDVIQGFDKEVYDEDWHMCTADFKCSKVRDVFDVMTQYHSKRGTDVAEIVIEGQNDIKSISTTGVEEIIGEINFQFDRDFTLEIYYWYDGVDKPGGT